MTVQHWVFGYGSLIWRVDFPYLERQRATLHGWARRFWQGSHDHRGTPEAPGRVLTLVPEPNTACVGMAYRVDDGVFAHLDYREKNGYTRMTLEVELAESVERVPSVVYVADEHNAAFLGPAPLDAIACHIQRSSGPSGRNADYLLELDAALRAMGVEDGHVRELARRVSMREAKARQPTTRRVTR